MYSSDSRQITTMCVIVTMSFVFSEIRVSVEASRDSWERRCSASMVIVWCSCSQHSESDRVVLLSVECPVICQMQQLSVSMETTHGSLFLFLAPLCVEEKLLGGRRKWWCLEREDKVAL